MKPHIISSADVPWEEAGYGRFHGMRYQHLTAAAIGDDYRVGVAIEELAPGKRSNPAHYHIFEEEHVYILEGSLTLRLGERRYEMKAGDYVCFPAGQKAGHCLVNDGETTCRYVVLGENNPNEVSIFTDTGKVNVRSLGRRALFDVTATRDYWQGEDTGVPDVEAASDVVTMGMSEQPLPPVSEHSVAWQDEGDGQRFGGKSRHLTYAAFGNGDYHVGVLIEAPAPGKRLCPKHYHMLEEEHALILEGELTLLFGDASFPVKPGDYVCFPAGERTGHSFLNSGGGPCRYLMIGERNPNDVCVYPDSNKVMVRALRSENDIFDLAATKGYWDGETG